MTNVFLSQLLAFPSPTSYVILTCYGIFHIVLLCFVVVCNWGQEWESAEIETHTQYKAFTAETIEAKVGIKIGLRNVNITLKGLVTVHITAD